MNYLYFLGIFLLFINIICAGHNKKLNNEGYYLVFVNNTYDDDFKIYSENKKRDGSQLFIESLIDEIDNLIVDNINTYQYPEKLEILKTTSKLRKRNNGSNDIKISNSYPVSSANGSVVLYTYLSESLSNNITSIDNVYDCISNSENIFTLNKYYDEKEILTESHWKGLKVQENASLHLSLISQGKYNKDVVNKYDKNYYYPSSAGKDIDIIVMDNNFNFRYSEFSNEERTAKCVANIRDGVGSTDNINTYCGSCLNPHGEIIADVAAGLNYGVAKSANIYGISLFNINDDINQLEIFGGLQFAYENLIRPHKTIINLSFGSYLEKNTSSYNQLKDIVDLIIRKGGIVVAAAGNDGKYISNDSTQQYVPCAFDNVICVGGIASQKVNELYTIHEQSNYGPSVNIYAPYNIKAKVLGDNIVSQNYTEHGTSYSSPLVAGMIATYMSENPNIEFTPEIIKKYLKDTSATEIINYKGETCLLANNGKHIVYSSDSKSNGYSVHPNSIILFVLLLLILY
ncbi:subtilisin-like protein [Anaeromyces robustus]|uniref:Subtilisin-like protein n=1 Tax=Anaeromyces robustus TaxID=1754192 RepID=A0A1Y1XJB4_9FUNG|nr:subtilisin-like protein [Anaeromyces robustus]|eukprot:ORX85848.1 subtilisin-like protein [Anaeromyces robustus]